MLEGCSNGGPVSESSEVNGLNAQILVQSGANAPARTASNANESNRSYSSTNGGLATGDDEDERYIQQQTTDPGSGSGRMAEGPSGREPQERHPRQNPQRQAIQQNNRDNIEWLANQRNQQQKRSRNIQARTKKYLFDKS